MCTFYFVRHAHANWIPDEDRPLSARGQADAIRVANILQQFPIGAIVASPFRRAQQTVEPLAARLNVPILIDQDLQERRLGIIEDREFFQAIEATWRDPLFAHPGGETNANAQQRGLSVLHRLRDQCIADHTVIATHGNLMVLMLQGFDASVDFAFWKSLSTPDIYRLIINRDREAHLSRLWQENR